MKRQERLKGETSKHEMCASLYITINVDEKGNPVEVFCNSAKLGTCQALLNATSRLVSKLCQLGDLEEAIDVCSKIRCPAMQRQMGKITVTKEKDIETVPWSCPDAIARELRRYEEKKK